MRGSVNPTALIRATGPMHFLEHDMPPHEVRPRGTRGRGSKKRATGRKALLFDGTYAPRVQVSGSRGSRPFERAVLATRHKPAELLDREVQAAIRRCLP